MLDTVEEEVEEARIFEAWWARERTSELLMVREEVRRGFVSCSLTARQILGHRIVEEELAVHIDNVAVHAGQLIAFATFRRARAFCCCSEASP